MSIHFRHFESARESERVVFGLSAKWRVCVSSVCDFIDISNFFGSLYNGIAYLFLWHINRIFLNNIESLIEVF